MVEAKDPAKLPHTEQPCRHKDQDGAKRRLREVFEKTRSKEHCYHPGRGDEAG